MELKFLAKKEMCVILYSPHREFRLAHHWIFTGIDGSGEMICKRQRFLKKPKTFTELKILFHEESRISMELKKNDQCDKFIIGIQEN